MKKIIVFVTVFLIVFGVISLHPNNYNSTEDKNRGLVFQPEKQDKAILNDFIKSDYVEMLFVGDMMFDRAVRRKINSSGNKFIFEKIQNILEGNDLIIGNLEGTITKNQSLSIYDNSILRFTFDEKIAEFLKSEGFDLISLANNHSLDFGEDGFNQTVNNLYKNNIKYFGSANNTGKLSEKLVINDKNFCFVGYHDLYDYNSESVINEIKKIEEECYKTIVMPHWGEEYLSSFTDRQQKLAYSFIDSGADLIIGTHPHVVEPVEIYKNKAIFYSIGNFVFDQYFSFETSHGLALKVLFDTNKTMFELIPVSIQTGEVDFVDSETAKKVLSPIDSSLISKKNNKYNSYGFYIYE